MNYVNTHVAIDDDPSTPGEHIASLRSYLVVWGALMVFTALTVAVAQFDLGALNLPLALGIATLKAALVALFFMHLFYDDKFNLVILVTGFIFVMVFFALTFADLLFRGAINPREGRDIPPPAAVAPAPLQSPQ